MADEKTQAPEEEAKPPKGKKSLGKILIIVGVAVVLLAGGGFAAYTFLGKKPAADAPEAADTAAGAEAPDAPEESAAVEPPPAGEDAPEAEPKDLDKLIGTMVPLETFLVNIDDEGTTRFLKTSLTLEVTGDDVEEEVKKRLPQVRDAVLLLLSSKSFADIRTYEGKFLLREEILDLLNGMLVTGKVKNVYFTEFVVQ